MSPHEPFKFKNLDELKQKVRSLGLGLRFSDQFSIFSSPINIGDFSIPNRLAIHPMEGCDANPDGSPTQLTFRRYERFGGSGVGLAWFEATAIASQARANPRQLMLTEANKNEFRRLLQTYENAEQKLSGLHIGLGKAIKILQITHSGRYSRPGKKNPIRLYNYEPLDSAYGQSWDQGTILSDEDLDQLPEQYAQVASLAKELGFDGVDIKACHRYLICESLSAFTRANSKYGGESLAQRAKLFTNIVEMINNRYGGPHFLVATRLNIYDGIPYPYGFGVFKQRLPSTDSYRPQDLPAKPDISEPAQLLQMLHARGVRLANLTMANPYFNPYISRPFDSPSRGASIPNEHPLEGVSRFIELTRQLRKILPKDMALVGTGYSWLRQYAPFIAAAELQWGNVDLIGFGRMAFANPEFARQILIDGGIDSKKACITCSKCTELMRLDSVTGCVVRDSGTYFPIYQKLTKKL